MLNTLTNLLNTLKEQEQNGEEGQGVYIGGGALLIIVVVLLLILLLYPHPPPIAGPRSLKAVGPFCTQETP